VPHPLCTLKAKPLGVVAVRLGILLVFTSALMRLLDVPLQGEAAPLGIVSFELAGTPYRALAILLEWDAKEALGHARLSLIVDFAYLLVYGLFFATLAAWIGNKMSEAKWSSLAAWAATLAAVCDAIENSFLLYQVGRFTTKTPWPQLAASFAMIKFALLLAAAAYCLLAGLGLLRRRYRRPL
jgi:hypothetical protein